MGTKTEYYDFNLPADTDYADQNQFNENFEVLDTTLHNMQSQINSIAAGLKYKGAVNYYSQLPSNAEIGDAYTVLYAGSSGTVPDGTEYVRGELNGTAQWIDFSKDTYTKAEVDALLAAKQALLNANNKLDPAFINYDSTHRAVSDTEKSTWNSKQNAIDSSHKLSADLVDDTSTTNKFASAAELEQIETNKNNILSLTPTVLKDGFTLSTTWRELPELRITIPANTICRVSAMQTFNAADPTGLILSYGDTDANRESLSNLWAKVENSAGGTVSLETSAIIDNSTSNERTLYVWATAKASGTNFVRAVYEKLA